MKAEFAARGCYFLKGEETDKVRKTILINGALNAKIVGQKRPHASPSWPAFTVPETTKILIGEVDSVELSEEFAHEKLSPVLAMYRAKDFDDALAKAEPPGRRRRLRPHRLHLPQCGTQPGEAGSGLRRRG